MAELENQRIKDALSLAVGTSRQGYTIQSKTTVEPNVVDMVITRQTDRWVIRYDSSALVILAVWDKSGQRYSPPLVQPWVEAILRRV